ncbi:hypothetical protein [Candidatus Nitrospira bockiana]
MRVMPAAAHPRSSQAVPLGIVAGLLLFLLSSTACAQFAVDVWKEHMQVYGQKFCRSGDNYYDAARVYYQIGDYTGQSDWNACAEAALKAYRDGYLKPNQYKAAGWMIFPHGLLMHYERTKDEDSKQALIEMAGRAAFARHEPTEWLKKIDRSREVAYNIQSKLLAERVGYNDRQEVERLVGLALGHYEQWFVSRTAEYVRPFMAALTAEALILWYDKTQDPKVLPALKTGADWMWEHLWVEGAKAFKYTDRSFSHGGEHPAPDLNLLIAPLYGWVYKMTGDPVYRERGDKIFAGGVQGAYLREPKHFNQNYRWSIDYVRWRNAHRNDEPK